MTTPPERWLLDTNVWIFGLRRDDEFPACAHLLDRMRDFYRLVNQYPEFIGLSWEPAPTELVEFYEQRGCRKGDAVIAAHAEASGTRTIVSENRQFLQTIKDLPVELVTAEEAQSRLAEFLP